MELKAEYKNVAGRDYKPETGGGRGDAKGKKESKKQEVPQQPKEDDAEGGTKKQSRYHILILRFILPVIKILICTHI